MIKIETLRLLHEVIDDVNTRLVENGETLMALSQNSKGCDMSLTVEHLIRMSLEILWIPKHQKLSVQEASEILGITLLENTVASAVMILGDD